MDYLNAVILGTIVGGLYAVIGVSVTLMFRTTGVLSFAHIAFMMLSAYLYTDFASLQGWPTVPAALAALGITVIYGLVVERIAIRPVASASPVVKLIATIAVFALTVGIVGARYATTPTSSPFLLGRGTVDIGGLDVPHQRIAIFVFALGVTGALGWFLRRTRFGIVVRATASNSEAVELMGVNPTSISRFNWVLAATVAGIAGILFAPLAAFNLANFPGLLVKAFAAALVGGLASLPLTLVGGIAVGVIESVLTRAFSQQGIQEFGVLVLVMTILVTRPPARLASTEAFAIAPSRSRIISWIGARGQRVRDATAPLASAWGTPLRALAIAALGFLALVPIVDEFWGFVGARTLFFVLQALSMVILVGWTGQVSLMHGAFAGVGGFVVSVLATNYDWPLELALPAAALAGMAMGALVAIPALRLSAFEFSIMSVVFAAWASAWLFPKQASAEIPRDQLFGIDLFDSGNLYAVMLVMTAVVYLLAWNAQRSVVADIMAVSRESPVVVEHFGTRVPRVKIGAFMVASFIAGLGGALFGMMLGTFSPGNYGIQLSLSLLLYSVIGGIDSLFGPILAGIFFGVVPELFASDVTGSGGPSFEIIAGLAVIALLAYQPKGMAGLLAGAFRRRPAVVASGRLGYGRFDLGPYRGEGNDLAGERPDVEAQAAMADLANGHHEDAGSVSASRR